MSIRTSSKRVDHLEAGDRLMLLGIQVAVVVENEPMIGSEPIAYRDLGRRGREPIFWHWVLVQWEKNPAPGLTRLVLPGNKFVALRDTNPDPEHLPG